MTRKIKDIKPSKSGKFAKPQLDGDPIENRRKANGSLRLSLNQVERQELRERQLIARAVERFIAEEAPIVEIAKELDVAPETILYWIAYDDKADPEWRKTLINRIIDRILNLDRGYKRSEIAAELGITIKELNRIIQSDDFKEIYAQRFIALRSDPNIKATQAYVVENLLPKALKLLEQEITDPDVPWSIKDKAIERIFRMTGIGEIKPIQDDRHELVEFLKNKREINVTITLPSEFQEALNYVEGEIVNPPLISDRKSAEE